MMMIMLTVIWDMLGLRDELSDLSWAYQRLRHRVRSTQTWGVLDDMTCLDGDDNDDDDGKRCYNTAAR